MFQHSSRKFALLLRISYSTNLFVGEQNPLRKKAFSHFSKLDQVLPRSADFPGRVTEPRSPFQRKTWRSQSLGSGARPTAVGLFSTLVQILLQKLFWSHKHWCPQSLLGPPHEQGPPAQRADILHFLAQKKINNLAEL